MHNILHIGVRILMSHQLTLIGSFKEYHVPYLPWQGYGTLQRLQRNRLYSAVVARPSIQEEGQLISVMPLLRHNPLEILLRSSNFPVCFTYKTKDFVHSLFTAMQICILSHYWKLHVVYCW
ncbi:hypothetical protein GOP47_0005305 [Adiantum capillus-veneris]|uniref:Uncharacterized protein n=1 Tax=Adiantum capillus-veneris TaxID=13818 RepID=A0A9D4ZNG5_ADICA|nr:hypothetical protein GOP47_0005305 [Adiantum capillus-veneris]